MIYDQFWVPDFISMAMVLSLNVAAFAEDTATAATGEGSITVNSPVIGAKYAAYQIFDMTANADYDSFSYTISKTSPFYDAVVAYATAKETIKLTATNSDPNTFNISIPEGKTFDAQDFGKEMLKAVNGTPAVADDPETPEDETQEAVSGNGATPIYPATLGNNPVTVNETDQIQFTGLDLGYYLINATYPSVEATVNIPGTDPAVSFTNADTEDEINSKIASYVNATVTQQYVKDYVDANELERTLSDGSKEKITSSNITADEMNDIMDQLKETLTADTKAKITAALANAEAGAASDINVKEPILVFVDSTTPDVVINEKNEIPKWDIPVNPEGYADVEGLPDHGEPSGGKNIIVGEDKDGNSIYADWSEANVGDKVHYQLRINAMNFIRESDNDSTINQAKEYWLADYQNPNMEFDATQKLLVTIVDENRNKVTDTTNALYSAADTALDYTAQADAFFMNDDGTVATTAPADIFAMGDPDKGGKKGIMVPWVKVTTDKDDLEGHPIYTTNKVVKKVNGEIQYQKGTAPYTDGKDAEGYTVDENGYLLDKKGEKIPEVDEYYVYSIYNSDVTIVVDYYMTLKDTAVVDEPGNKNFAQYAYTPVEPEDTVPTEPNKDTDEPSNKKEKDDATVYTYALAIQKVDENGANLAGAKFKIKGLTVTEKAPGYYKVKAYNPEAEDFDSADELEMDANGLLVIEGLMTSATLTLQETVAPDGYNKLEGTKEVNATKTGETVTTTSSTTYYDAQGNEVATEAESSTSSTEITTIDELKAAAITVENKQGTELPSTGGIGTTIFYVVGAILVIGAGVVLITRRRMDA